MRSFSKSLVASFLYIVCIGVQATVNGQSLASFDVSNPTSSSITSKVFEVVWSSIEKGASLDTSKLIIIDAKTQKQVVFQMETKGTSSIQNILVELSLAPKEKRHFLLSYGKRIPFVAKTYGRFVPERKDDFAWENDKIAFRMYGKALEQTPKEMAYGMDVWVKRTTRMIINERYLRGEYHVDHGDGMDYYHVGFTLGAGNVAPYINDSIWYSKNFVQSKVLDNGPLRVSFQLFYDNWDVAGRQVKAVKTISLDAGSQLNRVEVKYDGATEHLPVAVGIIRRKDRGAMYLNEQQGVMGYWEPTFEHDGTTAVGCVFPDSVKNMNVNTKHLLTIATCNSNNTLVYYTGAAWDRTGEFTNSASWFEYLSKFKEALKK